MPSTPNSKPRGRRTLVILATLALLLVIGVAASLLLGVNRLFYFGPDAPRREFAREFYELGLARAGLIPPAPGSWGQWESLRPEIIGSFAVVPPGPSRDSEGRVQLPALDDATTPALRAELDRRAVWPRLDALAGQPIAHPEYPPGEFTTALTSDTPVVVRALARLLGTDLADALAANDVAAADQAFTRLATLAAIMRARPQLIDELVAVAVESVGRKAAREALINRRVSPEIARLILRRASDAPASHPAFALRGERLYALALIYANGSAGPLRGVSRGAQTDVVNTFYDAAIRLIEAPRDQRAALQPALDAAAAEAERSPLSSVVVVSMSSFTRALDQAASERAALTTMAALEVYRAQSGTLPESLEALVPSILQVLPLDPFSGEPLRFTRTEQAPGYVLYSVGLDGVDDGGTAAPQRFDAFHPRGKGTDFRWTDLDP